VRKVKGGEGKGRYLPSIVATRLCTTMVGEHDIIFRQLSLFDGTGVGATEEGVDRGVEEVGRGVEGRLRRGESRRGESWRGVLSGEADLDCCICGELGVRKIEGLAGVVGPELGL
jgi:hypothetical protein